MEKRNIKFKNLFTAAKCYFEIMLPLPGRTPYLIMFDKRGTTWQSKYLHPIYDKLTDKEIVKRNTAFDLVIDTEDEGVYNLIYEFIYSKLCNRYGSLYARTKGKYKMKKCENKLRIQITEKTLFSHLGGDE